MKIYKITVTLILLMLVTSVSSAEEKKVIKGFSEDRNVIQGVM